MAEDLLPLLGHNMNNDEESDENSSDSDTENEEMEEVDEEQIEVEIDSDVNSRGDADEDTNNNGNVASCSIKQRKIKVNFDKSLPSAHTYLGSDLEDVSGRTVHEETSCVTLPLMTMIDVVLVPGQTIPLQLFHPRMVATIKVASEKDRTFGIVTYRFNNGETSKYSIGTTAEIFSIKDETDDSTAISTVRVLAKGRQRFEVMETFTDITGVLMGKVNILPESTLPDFLDGARPPSHLRWCFSSGDNYHPELLHTAVDRKGRILASVRLHRPRMDRLSSAYCTRWPPWVYRMYDTESLVQRIHKELRSWNTTLQTISIPEDPVELSYWIAQNFPLNTDARIHLLKINNAVQRLRCELSLMQQCSTLCCTECGLQIANKNDVFSMSVDGLSGAYVNPGGYVHETLTVYKTQNLKLSGRPSTEHSWFPGYAWTVVECRGCSSHRGWQFTATKKSLSPQKFWGLCRPGLVPKIPSSAETDDVPLM